MRRRPTLPAIVLVALLAACGGPAEQAARPAGSAATPTAAPPPTAAPAVAAPTVTAPTVAAPAAEPATAAGPAAAAPDGPPQGRTAEGYPVLGDPDAPVTLTMYSDFL